MTNAPENAAGCGPIDQYADIVDAINRLGTISCLTAHEKGQFDRFRQRDDDERRMKLAGRIRMEVDEAMWSRTKSEWGMELADVIIAAASIACSEGVDIGRAVVGKMLINKDRPRRE